MKKIILSFILLMGLVTTLGFNVRADDSVVTDLQNLSKEINTNALASSSISNEEMDVVLFRLKKEIEKVPEYNLSERHNYDLRLIQALTEIVYNGASSDYLGDVKKIKNLADNRLYVFPLYSDLLAYQLDAVILFAELKQTNDSKYAEWISFRLSSVKAYLAQYRNEVLDSVDLSAVSTVFVPSTSPTCASLF